VTAASQLGTIQAAVYAVLGGDAELTGLVTGVYDTVPEGTAMPYVVLGEATEIPDNRLDGLGRQTTQTLHVWSRYRGFAEANRIAGRLVALLDHQPLPVVGVHHVMTLFEFSQTLRDPDPQIRHVPVRFRIYTEQEG
jgi:hypothetical protein